MLATFSDRPFAAGRPGSTLLPLQTSSRRSSPAPQRRRSPRPDIDTSPCRMSAVLPNRSLTGKSNGWRPLPSRPRLPSGCSRTLQTGTHDPEQTSPAEDPKRQPRESNGECSRERRLRVPCAAHRRRLASGALLSRRRRLREAVDEQSCTDGAPLDGCDLQVLVIRVRTAPLSAETVDANGVRRHELHVARAA